MTGWFWCQLSPTKPCLNQEVWLQGSCWASLPKGEEPGVGVIAAV